MEKGELREMMKAERLALEPEEQERLSLAACAAVVESAPFARAKLLLVYQPFRGEVATAGIVAAARRAGKALALPRVVKHPRSLTLHRWDGDIGSLAVGAYGIREPGEDWPQVPPGAVDLVVVPGLAFDRWGRRLGYGGGYYDRLLPAIRAANSSAVCLGLGYPFQVVPALPAEAHDVPLDGVATATGLFVATV